VGELVLGTHVDEGYRSATQTVEQLLSRHRLHIVARPKIACHDPRDLGATPLADAAERS